MPLADIHLLRPAWLLALLPLAFVLWRMARGGGADSAWRKLVDAHLLPHLLTGGGSRASRLPLWLAGTAGVLGIVALAGPVWERLPQPTYQAQYQRVIVLDISPSMNATDMPPSRLAQARYEVQDLLRKFREGQTALIAYGAEPFVVSPLTADVKTIAAQVPSLSTELLPVHGDKRTGLALDAAVELLKQAGSTQGEVILLTDALDNSATALDAARKLQRQGYRLSVLGVGTASGAPVPKASGGFVSDGSGGPQLAKLDSERLRALAAAGGGRYATARLDDQDIAALLQNEPSTLRMTSQQTASRADQWREEGPWLLLALLPLAALAFRRGWISPLLFLVLVAPAPRADAMSWSDLWMRPDQQAKQLFEQGKTQEAATTFHDPDWRAAAAYRAGDYNRALQSLQGADRPDADYNRGNTLAKLGRYQDAIDAYDRALAADPKDADAKFNRDLVKRLLDKQQQQQQRQNQSAPQDPKQHQNSQNDSDQSQRTSKGQGEQHKNEQQQGQSAKGQDQPARQQKAHSGKDSEPQQQQDSQSASADEPDSASTQDGKQHDETQSSKDDQPDEATATAKAAEQAAKQPQSDAQQHPQSAASGDEEKPDRQRGNEPGLADLMDAKGQAGKPVQTARAGAPPEPMTEAQQAMEHQLNRVPDDPAGLLRQRFLLQHLRRTGQL